MTESNQHADDVRPDTYWLYMAEELEKAAQCQELSAQRLRERATFCRQKAALIDG